MPDTDIIVNDVAITADAINSETQYHPAENLEAAQYEAAKSLVIRELLMQRAVNLGLCQHDAEIQNTDSIFENLFDAEINTPQADDKICKHFYENNKHRFYTSPLFEASHILYLAPSKDDYAKDEHARQGALEKAEDALARIKQNPASFADIAKAESACSSAKNGGHLEQITKGQTTPAFEAALFAMQEGELSEEPLASEFGYHLIKVHKRIEGKQLPFDAVKKWIEDYLETQSFQVAFSQYVQLLAGQAKIIGFQLKQTDSPLVQ